MLIAVLVVTLIVYAIGKFSEYQSSQDKLANIENVAKFNEQFANYDRKNVQGYELVSLINKILDYNERFSSDLANNDQYTPIRIAIQIPTDIQKQLTIDSGTNRLFNHTDGKYNDNGNPNTISDLERIINTARECETTRYGSADNATRVAKNYSNLFPKKTTEVEYSEAYNAVKKYNTLVKDSGYVTSDNESTMISTYKNMYNEEEKYVYQYYEYMQFKRAYFNSNGITYNLQSNRVEAMSFECKAFVKEQ